MDASSSLNKTAQRFRQAFFASYASWIKSELTDLLRETRQVSFGIYNTAASISFHMFEHRNRSTEVKFTFKISLQPSDAVLVRFWLQVGSQQVLLAERAVGHHQQALDHANFIRDRERLRDLTDLANTIRSFKDARSCFLAHQLKGNMVRPVS